jgi:hypothetical protein
VTSHQLNFLIICIIMVAVVSDLIIFVANPPWQEIWNFFYLPAWVVVLTLEALVSFAAGDWLAGVLQAAFAAIGAWIWWHNHKNRKRRKKMAERVAERIVDLGGVLGVQPVED